MKFKSIFKTFLFALCCFCFSQSNAQDLHRKNGDLPCFNKNFNTIVHVAVDSLNRDPVASANLIEEMLEEASEYFSPICISFTACEINIIEDNYAYANLQDAPISLEDRIDKMESLFHKPMRINIFIVDSIQNVECGIGRFQGIRSETEANVFLELYNCPDVKISQNLAHQLGHLFGLLDTYDNSNPFELVDGSNCDVAGDLICDTPSDPYDRTIPIPGESTFYGKSYLRGCEFVFPALDPNEEYYQPDVGNIMSAYPCKCGFTREQYIKMSDVYFNSSVKQF